MKSLSLFLLTILALLVNPTYAGGKHDYEIIPYIPGPPVVNEYTTNQFFDLDCSVCLSQDTAASALGSLPAHTDKRLDIAAGVVGSGSYVTPAIGLVGKMPAQGVWSVGVAVPKEGKEMYRATIKFPILP